MCFKSEVPILPSPLGLQKVLGLIFPAQNALAGEPEVGLRPLAPLGEPLQCNYSPVCGSPTWGGRRACTTSTPFLPVPRGSSFIPVAVEDLFCWTLVFLNNSCPVNGGSLGMLAGGKRRVFLPHHLDPTWLSSIFKAHLHTHTHTHTRECKHTSVCMNTLVLLVSLFPPGTDLL